MSEDDFTRAVIKCALSDMPRKLPDDANRTEQDWLDDESQSQWRQDAFDRFFVVASSYLNATIGGKQTSRDMHMFCQGFKTAVSAMETGRIKRDMDGEDYRLAPFCEHMTGGGSYDLAKGVRGTLLHAIRVEFEHHFRTKVKLEKQTRFIDALHRIITEELSQILVHGWRDYDGPNRAANTSQSPNPEQTEQ